MNRYIVGKLIATGLEQDNMFYVCLHMPGRYIEAEDQQYLHTDGAWRNSTFNPTTKEYTGYFATRKKAQRCLTKNHFVGYVRSSAYS